MHRAVLDVLQTRAGQQAERLVERLYGPITLHTTCCLNRKESMSGSCILTPCVTCYQQYKKICPDAEPVFLLEKLLETDIFPFPDYQGMEMSIQDTCSARLDPKVLSVVRRLLERMNIRLSEPQRSGNHSKCCGQKFYGKLPLEEVESLMAKRLARCLVKRWWCIALPALPA